MKYFIILLVVFMFGCSATFQPTGQCTEGQSLILSSTNNNPTNLDKSLLVVNFSALEAGTYTAEQATDFLDKIEDKARQGISYLDFADFLITEIDNLKRYVGISLILLGDKVQEIGLTGGQNFISPCDTQLILAHIVHQRQIVSLY